MTREELYLRPVEVARRFGVAVSTLETWRARRTRGEEIGPRWHKRPGGRAVLYPLSECEKFFLGTPIAA